MTRSAAGDGLTQGATASSYASIVITFTTDADYSYDIFSTGSGPNDIPNQSGFEVRLSEPSSSTDLFLQTEGGTTGSFTGLLLAGHTYRLSGLAMANSSSLPIVQGTYHFQLLLAAPVPEPAVALLLLLAGLCLVRRHLGRAQ